MKNEFLFKSILLTDGKKNYASIQEVQEGNLVPKSASLAISGLQIAKVGTPKSTSKALERILYEDILDTESIDQIGILNSLAVLERTIFDAIRNGKTTYYKPVRIKPASSYENPMRIQGIKGAVAYNDLKEDYEEGIDLTTRNEVLVIKTKIDKKEILRIKDTNPNMYEKMLKVLNDGNYKGDITSIAIPYNADTPKWILDFVNYNEIINDNIGGFPLDATGLSTLDNTNIPYSNILKL
jgi:hypothetical protein